MNDDVGEISKSELTEAESERWKHEYIQQQKRFNVIPDLFFENENPEIFVIGGVWLFIVTEKFLPSQTQLCKSLKTIAPF